jgi:hypothetical protein
MPKDSTLLMLALWAGSIRIRIRILLFPRTPPVPGSQPLRVCDSAFFLNFGFARV